METNVFDVAKYILAQSSSPITAMKLQKLVYYCQAWSLVWDEKPLFKEKIEAWANGPVVPKLYELHKGNYYIDNLSLGDKNKIEGDSKDTMDKVLETLLPKTAKWLIDLTHLEDPWKNARKGLEPGERGNNEISWESMATYYSNL
jgi:uncharacterized phage-associated protein